MSITTAITNLEERIANAYTAIENMGGTLPATRDAANLATAIENIPSGEPPPKYGITIDDILYTTTTGDTTSLEMYKNVSSLNFANVTKIPQNGMQYAFYGKSNPKAVSFPALRTIEALGMYNAFKGSSISSVSFPELSSIGENGFSNAFEGCASLTSISFPKLSAANEVRGFYAAFLNSDLKSAEFSALLSASNSCFQDAFNASKIEDITFPELSVMSGTDVFSRAFYGCTTIKSASFPKLTTVSQGGFNAAFQNCTALSSISFPELSSISVGASSFENAFYGCTKLSSISFPKLETIYAGSGFRKAFDGCKALTTISFPELTVISTNNTAGTTTYGAFVDAFQNCTNLTTVSFPKLQSITKQQTSYSTFGTAFKNTNVTTLSFPALTSIVENTSNANMSTFANATALTSINFPVLTSIKKTATSTSDDLQYLFGGCTNLTEIHFSSANQMVIEASAGYASKWGAPNANCQIYFDL